MTDLKTKLLEADGGSRELDQKVIRRIKGDWPMRGEGYIWPLSEVPHLTTSLDAALALVREAAPEWDINMFIELAHGADVALYKGDPNRPDFQATPECTHKSPAIALCLALLSALEKEPDQ